MQHPSCREHIFGFPFASYQISLSLSSYAFCLLCFILFSDQVLLDTGALWSNFIVQFFYYLLLLYGFIPISLYVSQNFMRFFQVSGLVQSFFYETAPLWLYIDEFRRLCSL